MRSLKCSLSRLHLLFKILLLVTTTTMFFLYVIFVKEQALLHYYFYLLLILILLGIICRMVVNATEFWFTVVLWMIGAAVYYLIAIPYTLVGYPLTPYQESIDHSIRLAYTLMYPTRLLAVLFVGMLFVEITSPIEFLFFGRPGLYMLLVFRSFEYAKSGLVETIESMKALGLWPEGRLPILSLKKTKTIFRYSPQLIVVVIRNFVGWLPWAMVQFKRAKLKYMEV